MPRSIRIEYPGAFYHVGLAAGALQSQPGSDKRKVAIALEIWEKTTMNMSWIAEKLWMKSAANVSQQIGRAKKKKQAGK